MKTAKIETAITSYKVQGATLKVIKEFKEAEKLECIDTDSRKMIGKHRKDVKGLIQKVEDKRLDNRREFIKRNDTHAILIKDALGVSRDVFDEKIKSYDKIADDKKKKKDLEKKKTAGLIQYHIDGLEVDCDNGQEYNITAIEIKAYLENLKRVEISEDFGERTEEAELILKYGIENTQSKYDSRIAFEKEQAEQTRIKEEQEEKAKELEEKEAQLKEAQAKADKIAKEEKDKADKIAEAEAEKLRLANKKLEADNLALQKGKDELAAKEKAIKDEKQLKAKIVAGHALAILDHAKYKQDLKKEEKELRAESIKRNAQIDIDQKAKLKKDKQYAKDIKSDKKILSGILNDLDRYVSGLNPLNNPYKKDVSAQVELDLIISIKAAIETAQTEADGL